MRGKSDMEKGEGWVRCVEKWLKRNPGASTSDRAAAIAMLDDLRAALGGN